MLDFQVSEQIRMGRGQIYSRPSALARRNLFKDGQKQNTKFLRQQVQFLCDELRQKGHVSFQH